MLISFGVITCLSIMEFGTTAALEIIRREDFSHVFKFVKPDEHRLKRTQRDRPSVSSIFAILFFIYLGVMLMFG